MVSVVERAEKTRIYAHLEFLERDVSLVPDQYSSPVLDLLGLSSERLSLHYDSIDSNMVTEPWKICEIELPAQHRSFMQSLYLAYPKSGAEIPEIQIVSGWGGQNRIEIFDSCNTATRSFQFILGSSGKPEMLSLRGASSDEHCMRLSDSVARRANHLILPAVRDSAGERTGILMLFGGHLKPENKKEKIVAVVTARKSLPILW